MAKHDVNMNMPNGIPVINADVDFAIKANGAKIGTLKVSKGAVEWLPANNSVTRYTLTWEQFGSLMERNGRVK